jgi:hypothetical protein
LDNCPIENKGDIYETPYEKDRFCFPLCELGIGTIAFGNSHGNRQGTAILY